MATSSKSPYQYYTQILDAWPTNIALESQWFVTIDFSSVGVLKNNLNDLVNYDTGFISNGWSILPNTIQTLIDSKNQTNTENLIGCVFAREVTVPNESVNITNEGLEYGGYQAPATAKARDNYKALSITFNETNSSFLDFIIRPWIISAGYFGMVARLNSTKSVKSTIDISYLAKVGSNQKNVVRKIFRFFNAVPTSIHGIRSGYQNEGLQYSNVHFAYDYYVVIDPTNGSYLQNTLAK